MRTKSPSYLIQRPSGWYCCLNVPPDVRSIVKKSQIRHPLGTSNLRLARVRAAYVAAQFNALVMQLRAGAMGMLTEHDIKHIVEQWLRDAVAMTDEARVVFGPYGEKVQAEERTGLEQAEQHYRKLLQSRDFSSMEHLAEGLANAQGITVDQSSAEFRRLCRELVKAHLVHIQTEQRRARGEFDDELMPVPMIGTGALSTPAQPYIIPSSQSSSTTLSGLFTAYSAEMQKSGAWRDGTTRTNDATLRILIEVLGDRPVETIDKQAARDFKDALGRYPVNRHKLPMLRGKSLAEIATIPGLENLSISTINSILHRASAMFRWAVNQGYAASNPFQGMTVRNRTKSVKEAVEGFTQDELKAIFNASVYSSHTYRSPWQFWLPLLGLFTGARIEELCQLHLDDIHEVDGVWVFDINDDPGRSLKNTASKRLVPIHDDLMRIGLLRHVEALRKAKKTRLFPELQLVKGKFSHYPSIWFGRLKSGLGMPSRRKAFHSFRHTMSAQLSRVQTEGYLINRLLGHEVGNTSFDTYGDDKALVQPMKKALHKVVFGVDLSHISWSAGTSSVRTTSAR